MPADDTLLQHPFRPAVEARDLEAMTAALAEDVRLHSPVAFAPFEGRAPVREVTGDILEVVEDVHDVDELAGAQNHALIFRAAVGGRQVQGLDRPRLEADGRVQESTVMVRSLSATIALAEAMAPRVGHLKGATDG